MKYLPNIITIIRLILIPIFVFFFFSPIMYNHIYALAIFLIAGLTDLLDGYIARKYNVITDLGKVLDPLADKLMLLTALACLSIYGIIPLWVLMLMVFLEGLLIIAGVYLYYNKVRVVVPANKLGKSATVLFAVAVVLMVMLPGLTVTWIILAAAVAAKLISFLYYTKDFINSKNEKKQ
ncbi:MAG: CDP-diacylglycerol--glycerol-3-phosphate 3-phosphatidyltransferase [Clostridiaceae bacterium]